MTTLLEIQRNIAIYSRELDYHAETVAKWTGIFRNQPAKLTVVIRRLDEIHAANTRQLAYWQGMLADWSQS